MDKINLFILDDSQEFIFLLTSFLALKGINVEAEFCPLKAMEKIKINKYDVIITDYLMDSMDGISFSREVQKISQNENTKIILLTAKDLEEEELSEVKNLGLYYLKKPILPNDLYEKIYKVLGK